jgi:opacity protein-like surface antigen
MKKIWTFIFLAALVPALSAQEPGRVNEISARIGGFSPNSRLTIDNPASIGQSGIAAGARYVRALTPSVGVGLDFNIMAPGAHDTTTMINNLSSSTKFDIKTVLLLLRYRWEFHRFLPYVLGGVGMHSTSLKIQSRPLRFFNWSDTGTQETRTIVDDTASGFAMSLEGGIDYPITDWLSAGGYFGWTYLPGMKLTLANAGNRTATERTFSVSGLLVGGALTGRF